MCNILYYLYPLIRPFTYIVEVGGQYYVLLLPRSITSRRDFTIRAVRSLLPALTYTRWYTWLSVVHLLHESSKGLPDTGNQRQVINLIVLCMLLRVWHPPHDWSYIYVPICRLIG